MKKLKKNLKINCIYPMIKVLLIVLISLLNVFKIKYIVGLDFVNTVLTLISILFGFLISAECNLFGRNITKEMKRRASKKNPGISQFAELKERFSKIGKIIMLLIMLSISYYLGKTAKLGEAEIFRIVAEIVSVIYIFELIEVLWRVYKESEILLTYLGNEAELEKEVL